MVSSLCWKQQQRGRWSESPLSWWGWAVLGWAGLGWNIWKAVEGTERRECLLNQWGPLCSLTQFCYTRCLGLWGLTDVICPDSVECGHVSVLTITNLQTTQIFAWTQHTPTSREELRLLTERVIAWWLAILWHDNPPSIQMILVIVVLIKSCTHHTWHNLINRNNL